MRSPLLKLIGLMLLGLLVTPAGVRTAMAQTGTPRPQLEEVLYQSLLDNLAADAAQATSADASAAAVPVAPRKATQAAAAAISNTSGATMRCLPSCDTADGRFLAIAGSNLATLSGSDLNLQISVPAAATSFTVGVFDGDARGFDAGGLSHWDTGVTTAVYEYTLYADPAADGAGTTVVEMVPGNPVLTGSMMPDNAWIDFTLPTSSIARTPSGNFFYHLKIRLITPDVTTLNAFKVRTDSVITGLTLDPVARPFSYISNPTSQSDLRILYPSFPAATPTTYDGTFSFYFDVPTSQASLTIWDGDFDRGKFDGTDLDTDDPDTPNAPFRPSWSTVDTVPEGVAVGAIGTTGNPADDRNPAGSGIYSLRSPSIRYDLIFPDGQTFANENPSGNLEWEQFKVSTDPFDRSQMDYNTSVIPPGTYQLRIQGVDLVNLNALLLPTKVVCIDDLGIPCTLLRPFALGDTVFVDRDADHVQGPGEPGIPGVVLELRDTAGFLLRTTTTDADGHYRFEVDSGSYQVVVAASNFNTGGPLSGYIATIANQITDTVTTDNVLTYDFGYRGTASIGDTVWLDGNGNGVQEAGENGLAGVTVQLLDGSGNSLGSTVTDGNGNYSFAHLAPGTYTVRVDATTLPAGLAPTYDFDGTGTANAATLDLAAGANRTDIDFGYRGTASLGDRVWLDLNANGVQDPGEAGINGVTVQLFDGLGNGVATATTSGDGSYTFSNLGAGTYTVSVDASTLPAGLAPSFDFDGTGTANTATVQLASGANRTDVDFGYKGTASLGDRVWYDLNGDGVQDAGETGLNGVTVKLLDSSNNVLATQSTSGNGNYTFGNLPAGSYKVTVDPASLPAGTVATFDVDGVATPNTASVTLGAGDARTDVDFGERGNASLGDRLWYDLNGNGAQDTGETGINGVTVRLLDSANNVIATATTASDGNYTFANLLAGTYSVQVVASTLPAGLVPSFDFDGTGTANIATLQLAPGVNRTDIDFGYRGTASIGDRVWYDLNGNGVQDSGETGINGITVQLLDSTGNVIATKTTSGDGDYLFTDLVAGTYTVRIVASSLPAGLIETYDLDGTGTQHTAAVTLAAGASRTDVDFGYRGTASIGDRVWSDTNGNGAQDSGETGINGVTVQLLDSTGTAIATTTTSGDGNYTFRNLLADNYTVKVTSTTLPAGVTPSYDLDGTATANTAAVTLTGGQMRTDVDFGYRGTASIGDRVWNDSNGNGAQDSGETGINGVTVQLLDSTGAVITTTTTSGDGSYTFSNLLAGNYTVKVTSTTLPAGVTPSYDLDGTATANTAAVTLTGGQMRTDVDFGYRGTGSIGDRVWYDLNGNGAQDSGETGINGVTVQLLDSSGNVTATKTTSGDGSYLFTNLVAGTYTVRIVASSLPAGLIETYDLDGTGSQHTAAVTLAAGASRTDVDFGYRGTASIGDRVWSDTNANGAQDSGEAGINGVTVQLLNSTGAVIATTTTSGDGSYTFSNLLAGNYTVKVTSTTLPAGVTPSYDLDGTATANTAAVTLTGGQMRTDVDFGYRGTASIGDRIWSDTNANGIQDSGEAGINGVTVQLLNSTGAVIATTTTSGDGSYTFSNLLAGNYTVKVTSTTLPAGVTPSYDLDGTATANTAAVTLTGGQMRTDVDFGYRGTASIGDRVWSDGDGDGVQDSGEPGINGVTVQLYNSSNVLVATTTTSGDGNYTFTGLAPGTYTVKVVSSTVPAGSTQTFDKDGTGTANAATVTLTAGQNRTDVDFGYRLPTCTAGYFQDQFTTNSFSNNDGTLSWAGSWIEYDTAGTGVSSGNVTVGTPYAGYLILRDYPDTGTQPSAARQANLSGFASATLSFDFHTKNVETDDAAVIEISKDGGATYTVLETLTGFTGDVISSRSYNITSYISSNTRIRFRISANYGGSDDLFKVDQVRIDGACTTQTPTGSIGTRVWKDSDSDGVQDSTETGLNGVSVQLLNSSGTVLATQTTSGNGDYLFTGLASGTYTVKVVSSTLPSGATQTYDLDGTGTAHTAAVTLSAGQNRTDVDFGYRLPTCTAGYFQDQFTTNSFSNNDGTLSWAGSWIEYDTAGTGVSSGNVTVGTPYAGYLILRDAPDTGTQPSAARQANLSGFASATLSFDFHTKNVETDDAAVIEISKDGGATYTVLETLTGFTGQVISSRSYNIASYISSNTRIRFRVSANYGGTDDLFKVDQVRIDAACQ